VIDKFNFLIALAREQHFGRAAEACGVTQPTMSASLKQLEEQLGVVIVRRNSRFQGFTPEGEHVLAWARRIAGDAKSMRQDLDSLKRGLTGHLRLAIIPTALAAGAALTTPFRERHPGVRFSIISRSSTNVLRELNNLDVDAGITYIENEPLGAVKTVPLYHEGYRLLTPACGPFGGRATVTWGELSEIPLCLLTPDMQNRRIVDLMIQNNHAPVLPLLESNSITALLSHVMTGKWSSIMPCAITDHLALPPNVCSIPIVAPVVLHLIGLVVPQRYDISPLTNALVREAERLAKQLQAPEALG
jgi:DNA-binding transcriptional LysR family regulator